MDIRKALLVLFFCLLIVNICSSQTEFQYHNSGTIRNELYNDSLHTMESGLRSSYLKSDDLIKIRRIDLIDSFYSNSYVLNSEGLSDSCINAITNECKKNGANHSLYDLYRDMSLSSILLVDEFHLDPDNIFFLINNIDSFKKMGFDHIAFGNLRSTDTSLNARQYPIQKSLIKGPADPLWGYLLRYAMHLGYKIDIVEDTDKYISQTDSLGNYRKQSIHDPHKFYQSQIGKNGNAHVVDSIFTEKIIAQNINNIFIQYPRSKIIVIGDVNRTSLSTRMAGGILLREFKRNVFSLDQYAFNSKTLSRSGIYDTCRSIKYLKVNTLGSICKEYKDRYDGYVINFPAKNRPYVINDIYGYGNLHGEFCGKKLFPDMGSLVFIYDYEEYKRFKDGAIPLDVFEFTPESGYRKRKYDVSKKVIVLYQHNKVQKQKILNE